MANILDKLDKYLINDLERLTGIKAHTIRIWEKRYNVIEPSRTDTNRRYYSGEQLKKLMNISTLIGQGFKISQVAELSINDLNKEIEKMHESVFNETVYAAYIHRLTEAMFSFDEVNIEITMQEAIDKLGFYDTMLYVLYPFLQRTGVFWRVDKTMPAEEHFAVNLVRRLLITVTDKLPTPDRKDKKFLLFLPPDEWHEIALLFANYIIRSKGVPTVYLGQNVPLKEVEVVAKKTHCTNTLCFYIAARLAEDINREVRFLSKSLSGQLYISGSPDMIAEANLSMANVKHLPNVDALLKVVELPGH